MSGPRSPAECPPERAPGSGLAPPPAQAALEARLGHRFAEAALLETALQHPSYAHERDGTRGYERLEFLGDAVIGLAAARLLFEAHPSWEEGHLTRARAALVNTRALASYARALGIPEHVRLGRTERKAGVEKDSILANVLEAVVGAVYLDGGLEPVVALARRLFAGALAPDSDAFAADPKTRFQEWAHATLKTTPRYVGIGDSGIESDDERFAVEVRLEGEVWGRAQGRTKRAAERAAAEQALRRALADAS
ncbi:MAG: ribonuclease III [Deltaproteobacteria bacterium]|nr:ribonuclease III [Deltaproteobacteria bacterium]